MLDLNKHKFFLVQVLKDFYSDIILANNMGFKGGTALMLFYDLPRYSIDLDFNLLDIEMADAVYKKTGDIISKYGRIKDKAKKHFSLIMVLDYGRKERNLKIEISLRSGYDSYEVRNFLGIPVRVMVIADMFAHKLCTLLDRDMLANRDIFDCWFLMQRRTPVNRSIVEGRTGIGLHEYLDRCINAIEMVNERRISDGLGELMDPETKRFVKTRLKSETISLLKLYREFPITS